jgi:hypothetical protein
MPQSVGWQFIGHIVRTILEGCSVTGDSLIRARPGKAPDRCYRKSSTRKKQDGDELPVRDPIF